MHHPTLFQWRMWNELCRCWNSSLDQIQLLPPTLWIPRWSLGKQMVTKRERYKARVTLSSIAFFSVESLFYKSKVILRLNTLLSPLNPLIYLISLIAGLKTERLRASAYIMLNKTFISFFWLIFYVALFPENSVLNDVSAKVAGINKHQLENQHLLVSSSRVSWCLISN